MAMYEPFNKTLEKRLRKVYDYNKEYILSGALTLATIATLMSGVSYCAHKGDQEVKKNLKILEQVIDEPRSEEKDLRYNFEKAYQAKKQSKSSQNK